MVSGGALVITTVEGWLLAPLWMGKAERLHVIVVYVGLLLWTWSWAAGGNDPRRAEAAGGSGRCRPRRTVKPASELMSS